MSRSNAELVAEVYPDVPLARDLGELDTLLSMRRRAACSATARSTPGVEAGVG
jgi:hypothetical protein